MIYMIIVDNVDSDVAVLLAEYRSQPSKLLLGEEVLRWEVTPPPKRLGFPFF